MEEAIIDGGISKKAKFDDGLLSDLSSEIVQNFITARETLKKEELSHRSGNKTPPLPSKPYLTSFTDHEFRHNLSVTALNASSILSRIRSEELALKWSTAASSSLSRDELFPGMVFNNAKPVLETTELWRLVKMMPKGALLHCHLGAMVDLEWVFETALAEDGMCICADVPLVDDVVRESAGIRYRFSKSAHLEANASIWLADYVPGAFIPVAVAADLFPDGGRKRFVAWMKDRCSITQAESLQHHLGVDDVWRKLNAAFSVLPGIVYYEPILRKFLRKFFTTLLEDKVRWVEFRSAPFTPLYVLGSETPTLDPGVLCSVLSDEIEKFKASEAGRGFWGARMIWAGLRFWSTDKIIEDMRHCIRLKKIYPALISGYDLVGHEDPGRTLESLTPELLWFQGQCKQQNLTIPLFLHAGETVGCGTPTDHNLYTAILLGSRRLGHAFSLYKHPVLISLAKSQNILVESCPISNEVLRYTASIMSHPLPALINRGVKACLCNDDPSMLGQGTSGLSHDFWQALQGWEDLGLAGLGGLAENSVRWGAFEDERDEEWKSGIEAGYEAAGMRGQRMREWRDEWEGFCGWVAREYGR
ncbi:hypothetical protein BJ875DRAFT_522657 [Amylocarpus encephaloides]|uniref:adenosine deaminase n=1 Tax=Amylocarpus encephaloides TaxID=45428 RepID=A0A9P7YU85_9HELO|nr:hypothetical protein BJ875DRAFT_522657 [Amylocarpus encephaloides]